MEKTAITQLSVDLFKRLSKKIYGKIEEERFLDHAFLWPDEKLIDNTILVVGINPSSADLNQGNGSDPCFIHYLPDVSILKSDEISRIVKTWGHKSGGKKFTYGQYFTRLYQLFENLNFYPLWCNKEYNDSWIEIPGVNVNEEDKFVLSLLENNSIRNYIIINDLIPIKETDSRLVIQTVLSNPSLLKDLNELLKLKINYLKPKMTIIFMQKSQNYFADAMRQLDVPIETYPFFKYLSGQKYQEIKDGLQKKLNGFLIHDKFSYLTEKYQNMVQHEGF